MSCRQDRIDIMHDVLIERRGDLSLHESIGGMHKGKWILWDGDKCIGVGDEAFIRRKMQAQVSELDPLSGRVVAMPSSAVPPKEKDEA